jgi:Tol biopolymer transport system component
LKVNLPEHGSAGMSISVPFHFFSPIFKHDMDRIFSGMRKVLLILLFVFSAADLIAQGFNSFSGRNHPYLNWKVAETEHFKIMYPDRLTGIEYRAAAIAEESYHALSVNLDVEFEEKIRIYLTDEDEINNGFAVPIGNGYTNIWVDVNDYAETWTGSEKWLRKVIAHELAHIFHFEATKTNLGLLNYVIGNPTPSFWTEGLAQYQTEKWDSQRGDRWLRTAIFDSRPSYTDGQSLINRRLLYASGNSQVRYFTEMYGDSTLADLLAQRETALGMLTYYDHNSAFRKTIDTSYAEFYEEWRKHVNIYYNTLASQMDRVDSLGSDPLDLPGQYYFDVKYSPDQSKIAVLSLPSLQRPVRRLYIVDNDSARASRIAAEGNIKNDITWSPDGSRIAYSRTVRGEKSSLLNDLFVLELDGFVERQLTFSRRAISPAFSSDGTQVAYIINEGGTGNIVILDLESGVERRVTHHAGDIQVIHLAWNKNRNELVFQRFDENGNRHLVLLDPYHSRERVIDDGHIDNRMPLISPDGSKIAFTSLRDEVPNVFITDLAADTTWRVTNLFTGGEALDWLASSDTLDHEKLVVKATETKRSEQIYLIDADLRLNTTEPVITETYTTWRRQEPPNIIPWQIEPDEHLIRNRSDYNSWKNITHVVSLALPYYAGPDDFGLFGVTTWTEPLAKHLISAAGLLSFGNFSNSYGLLAYINNQFYPTITISAFRAPGPARFYGRKLLLDKLTGADISFRWPLDRFEGSYRESWVGSGLRYVSIDPFTFRDTGFPVSLPDPLAGKQFDIRASWVIKKERPYYRNMLHPVDGYGMQVSLKAAEKIFGAETSFFTLDAGAYSILELSGSHRIFLSGRIQAQSGNPLPQDYIGFSTLDNIGLPVDPGFITLQSVQTERVRGYRSLIAGRRVAFGSLEYRAPFLPSLRTSIFGFFRLGPTSLALFADAGRVWDVTVSETEEITDKRLGFGTEIKNIVGLGPLRFIHSVGIAQPYHELFERDFELYYRIRASVPF